VKRIADQRKCVHFFLGHRNARGILPGVEFGPDPQPGCCPDVPDAVDDGLVRRQRGAAPVLRDVAEEPVLDLVPLARSRRKLPVEPSNGSGPPHVLKLAAGEYYERFGTALARVAAL